MNRSNSPPSLIEMCAGISASCMVRAPISSFSLLPFPSANLDSQLLSSRHSWIFFGHGTLWIIPRSRLSGMFASIRSFKLRSTKFHSSSQTSNTCGIINSYTNMGTAGSNKGRSMGHSKPMRTFISSGQPKELDKVCYLPGMDISNQPKC